jgi:hypothetical protein
MTDLTKILNNPEEHYPGNFDTPQRANAMLTGLCQDAANEIERLNAEVLEQCRINGMSAEREDALKAEVERLNKALTWEQNRSERIGTHGPGCHTWGASHYECLLRVNAELVEALKELVYEAETVSIGDYSEEAHDIAVSKARAALAKATGETK